MDIGTHRVRNQQDGAVEVDLFGIGRQDHAGRALARLFQAIDDRLRGGRTVVAPYQRQTQE